MSHPPIRTQLHLFTASDMVILAPCNSQLGHFCDCFLWWFPSSMCAISRSLSAASALFPNDGLPYAICLCSFVGVLVTGIIDILWRGRPFKSMSFKRRKKDPFYYHHSWNDPTSLKPDKNEFCSTLVLVKAPTQHVSANTTLQKNVPWYWAWWEGERTS